MNTDEIAAKLQALASDVSAPAGSFSAELDAMSAEEAWNRCCYAAWIDRKARLSRAAFDEAMRPARESIAALLDKAVRDIMRRSDEQKERAYVAAIACGYQGLHLEQWEGFPSGSRDRPTRLLAGDGTEVARWWLDSPLGSTQILFEVRGSTPEMVELLGGAPQNGAGTP